MIGVLSLIPFSVPMVMFIRIHILTPPAWRIAASIGLLVLMIGVTVHLPDFPRGHADVRQTRVPGRGVEMDAVSVK